MHGLCHSVGIMGQDSGGVVTESGQEKTNHSPRHLPLAGLEPLPSCLAARRTLQDKMLRKIYSSCACTQTQVMVTTFQCRSWEARTYIHTENNRQQGLGWKRMALRCTSCPPNSASRATAAAPSVGSSPDASAWKGMVDVFACL